MFSDNEIVEWYYAYQPVYHPVQLDIRALQGDALPYLAGYVCESVQRYLMHWIQMGCFYTLPLLLALVVAYTAFYAGRISMIAITYICKKVRSFVSNLLWIMWELPRRVAMLFRSLFLFKVKSHDFKEGSTDLEMLGLLKFDNIRRLAYFDDPLFEGRRLYIPILTQPRYVDDQGETPEMAIPSVPYKPLMQPPTGKVWLSWSEKGTSVTGWVNNLSLKSCREYGLDSEGWIQTAEHVYLGFQAGAKLVAYNGSKLVTLTLDDSTPQEYFRDPSADSVLFRFPDTHPVSVFMSQYAKKTDVSKSLTSGLCTLVSQVNGEFFIAKGGALIASHQKMKIAHLISTEPGTSGQFALNDKKEAVFMHLSSHKANRHNCGLLLHPWLLRLKPTPESGEGTSSGLAPFKLQGSLRRIRTHKGDLFYTQYEDSGSVAVTKDELIQAYEKQYGKYGGYVGRDDWNEMTLREEIETLESNFPKSLKGKQPTEVEETAGEKRSISSCSNQLELKKPQTSTSIVSATEELGSPPLSKGGVENLKVTELTLQEPRTQSLSCRNPSLISGNESEMSLTSRTMVIHPEMDKGTTLVSTFTPSTNIELSELIKNILRQELANATLGTKKTDEQPKNSSKNQGSGKKKFRRPASRKSANKPEQPSSSKSQSS